MIMAHCKKCNAELEPDVTRCPVCGEENPLEQPQQQMTETTELEQATGEEAAPQTETDEQPAEASAEETAAQEETKADAPQSESESAETGTEAAQAEAALTPEQAPQQPKKKLSGGAIAAIVVGAAIVLAALVFVVIRFVVPALSQPDNVAARESYSLSADELQPDSSQMSKPVAKVGEHELTNGVFQVYYWMQFYNLMNTYGDYAAYLGLDTTKPFDEQDSYAPAEEETDEETTTGSDAEPEETKMLTWEQYFVKMALESYKEYISLADAAEAEGLTLSEEYQSYLDSMEEDLQTAAEAAGMSTAEEYVQASFGTGTTVEDYHEYMQTYLMAVTYASHLQSSVECTDEDAENYFDENEETYAQSGITKVDQNVVNVRHILLTPEKDEDSDGDGEMDTSSEAAWEAAKQKADELYAQWKEDPTEDHFAELATENTADTASAEAGGLYEDVYPGQMVAEFNDWCFDPARQAGDNGIVKTDYGYHIIYYVSQGDYIYWMQKARADYINEVYAQRLQDVFADVEVKANYKNIGVNSVTDMMEA